MCKGQCFPLSVCAGRLHDYGRATAHHTARHARRDSRRSSAMVGRRLTVTTPHIHHRPTPALHQCIRNRFIMTHRQIVGLVWFCQPYRTLSVPLEAKDLSARFGETKAPPQPQADVLEPPNPTSLVFDMATCALLSLVTVRHERRLRLRPGPSHDGMVPVAPYPSICLDDLRSVIRD